MASVIVNDEDFIIDLSTVTMDGTGLQHDRKHQ